MNIIIQGQQGQGKTLTANHIASNYNETAIIRFYGFKKKFEKRAIQHVKICAQINTTPLFIFDELDSKDLQKALSLKKFISSLLLSPQIDAIFISNERIAISK